MKVTAVLTVFAAVAAAAATGGQDVRGKEAMAARSNNMPNMADRGMRKVRRGTAMDEAPADVPEIDVNANFQNPGPAAFATRPITPQTAPNVRPASAPKPATPVRPDPAPQGLPNTVAPTNNRPALGLGALIALVQGILSELGEAVPALLDPVNEANSALEAFASVARNIQPEDVAAQKSAYAPEDAAYAAEDAEAAVY